MATEKRCQWGGTGCQRPATHRVHVNERRWRPFALRRFSNVYCKFHADTIEKVEYGAHVRIVALAVEG